LYIGEIAAIATSMTFAINSTLFTMAGREVGAIVVNRLRLVAASFFLIFAHLFVLGTLWPVEAGFERWFWLGLSGIAGLVLGDLFLFQAFIWVGPRLSMLMMSLAPIFATLIAWIFLGEKLSLLQIIGIFVTIIGVIWVVIEKNSYRTEQQDNYLKGILFGIGGAIGQALGFVLAKVGLSDNFSPISANYIRMITAMVVIWVVTAIQKKLSATISQVISNPTAMWRIIAGAFSGPFVGVSLSLFALQHTSIGVASTLMALPPLFLLPVDHFYLKEKIGWGAIAGTILALVGVGILFLV
jgi:drug/metabolite transporter (DMT)-like permease